MKHDIEELKVKVERLETRLTQHLCPHRRIYERFSLFYGDVIYVCHDCGADVSKETYKKSLETQLASLHEKEA